MSRLSWIRLRVADLEEGAFTAAAGRLEAQ